jgi:hypothetical protein
LLRQVQSHRQESVGHLWLAHRCGQAQVGHVLPEQAVEVVDHQEMIHSPIVFL